MKTKFALLVGAVALLFSTQAWAACGGTIISLNNNNLGLSGVSVDLCVAVSGTTVTVSIDSINGAPGTNSIQELATNITSSSATSITGWNFQDCSNNGCTLDGFGSFNTDNAGLGSNRVGTGASWVFTGSSITDPGQMDFAVHLAVNPTCTGYFSDRARNGGPLSSPTAECSEVPEPASLTLLGTGLLGLAGVIRRRLSAR